MRGVTKPRLNQIPIAVECRHAEKEVKFNKSHKSDQDSCRPERTTSSIIDKPLYNLTENKIKAM